ncbi:MAG: zincin-like metallopeptidase domain-containing protein [Chloroflexota bacterium]|nr:zincin-like metallopeptidase domain-containing protein [Chloroflexota bacterium]
MGASFLSAMTNISTLKLDVNNNSYIKSWLKTFKDDKGLVIKAASQVQKAVDYILVTTYA